MLNDINFQLFSSKGEINFHFRCMHFVLCEIHYVSSMKIRDMYFSHDDNFIFNQFYITDFHWSYKEKTYLNKDDIKCV